MGRWRSRWKKCLAQLFGWSHMTGLLGYSGNRVLLGLLRSYQNCDIMESWSTQHQYHSLFQQLFAVAAILKSVDYNVAMTFIFNNNNNNNNNNNKKYVLSNSESVQCNFFIFDHVTFIQFKICCCVQNFMKIGWFFTEIWRYIDFQNGGRPPSWNCFTTIRDHPEVCCWPQLPVEFHVNLIYRSEDIAIWIFRIFGLKWLFRPPKWGFGGLWTPKCDYSSLRLPKGTSLHKSASFKLSTVKINWGVWPVGELTESVTDTHTGKFIFCPCIALDRQYYRLFILLKW